MRELEARREAERQRKLQQQEEELKHLQEEREMSIMAEQIKQLDEQRNAILEEQERTRKIELAQAEERRRAQLAEQERARQAEEQRNRQMATASAGMAAVGGTAIGAGAAFGAPSIPPPSYDMVNAIRSQQGVAPIPGQSPVYAPPSYVNATARDGGSLSPSAPPSLRYGSVFVYLRLITIK